MMVFSLTNSGVFEERFGLLPLEVIVGGMYASVASWIRRSGECARERIGEGSLVSPRMTSLRAWWGEEG